MQAHTTFSERLAFLGADPWPLLTIGSAAVLLLGPAFAALGTPQIDLMAPVHHLGIVGPTCGLTRGVVAVFRGQLGRAWQFNPASLLVVLAAVAGGLRAALAINGRGWYTVRLAAWRWLPVVSVLGGAALWAYQQAHAGFILHHLR